MRSFRHDYKNLLAGLSQQVGEGRLDALRASLSELDVDFDRRLGETIQLSTQIGNLRVPQVRSLLLHKLTDMREKGVEELLYAAEKLHKEYPSVVFELVGSYEEDYKARIEAYEKQNIVRHISYQKDIAPFYQRACAVLMPSYHEGMSNVVLEAAASGRPVLASQIPGCEEGFEDGVTGFGFAPRDREALLQALRRFMALSYEERAQMGKNARAKMEREFDRRQVVQAYMEEIQKII